MSQNRYEVLGKIAEGGLGSVYKAYDRNLRREVALKRVRADSQEEADRQADQLFEEARTISTLQHPHIVTVFDVGKDVEGAYIVMELLKGETLEDIIQRGALNDGDFRELVSQSLEGMIAAHATGLIHLDIKPQNFMVIWLPSGKFQIKILDFGLAKIAHQPHIQEVDADGSILGSIFFMAPEQFERSPVDVRTDLYSLGCVYYFALTQQYPFQGETAPEVMASHLYHSRVPLEQIRPDLPRALTAWVEWLMMRDPDARPVTASQAFEWFQAGQVPNMEPEQPFTDDGTVAMATPEEEEYIAEALPEDQGGYPPTTPSQGVPRYVRPGSSSGPLRPTAPRPTRPVARTPSGVVGARPAPRPMIRPVNIAAAMAPEHLRHKAPLPKWLTLWTPVGIAALVVAFFAFQFVSRARAESRFEALANMEKPQGNVKDVNLLLQFLEEPGNSQVAGETLKKLEGSDTVNTLISRYVLSAKSDIARKNLAGAIAARGINDAADPLLRQFPKVQDRETRIAIWQALGRVASPAHVPEMLTNLIAGDTNELKAAENALVNAASQDTNADSASSPFLQAYRSNSGADDVRATYIRVLSRLGGKDSLKDVTDALENNNPQIRNAAAIALADWPNAEPIPALEAFIPKAKDPYIRKNAVNSLGNLAGLSGETPQEEIAKSLIEARNNTKDAGEMASILSALERVAAPEARDYLLQLPTTEPRSKPQAEAGVKRINALLLNTVPVTGDTTTLPVEKAVLTPGPLLAKDGVISNWFGIADQVSWLVQVEQPGEYEVQLSQTYPGTKPGHYTVTFGSKLFPRQVDISPTPKTVTLGKARIPSPGHYRLWIRPKQIALGDQLMRLDKVVLTKTGS
ncbi:serine/threonine protein kinase [Roseimicrobium gellanilyticum]|uniref:Serine/threonine protein kinase n=1 Tax=Roseimicrobium gellanilyticum TaxID=748857 RepID=A0A366HUV8_9BACT|nr:protein kinase [Roseimicrobium gellanilyticum]RBP47285.1 serine/threonine protein kinase [Roseimicrobium gellanilyticum]